VPTASGHTMTAAQLAEHLDITVEDLLQMLVADLRLQ